MFFSHSRRFLLVRHLNLPKNFILQRCHVSNKVKNFEKLLDFPSSTATDQFLRQHNYLMDVDNVSDSVRYLKEIGITIDNIREHPEILCTDRITLQNRYQILNECGCSTVDIHILKNYKMVISFTETTLKRLAIIDHNVNLQQQLANLLNVKFRPCAEEQRLWVVRLHFLRLFFVDNGLMTVPEFNKALIYVRHKSYQSIEKMLKILTEQFRVPRDEISNYKSALRADPDNVLELLTIKPIAGVNIENILKMHPTLMCVSADRVQRTLRELEKVGVSSELAKNRPDILVRLMKLDPDVVQSRLEEISAQPFFQAMQFHPMFLKLVLCYYAAEHQIENTRKKCFSIEGIIRIGFDFKKYVAQNEDRHLQRDGVLFLARNLEMDAKKVKSQMRRHPYWLNIPFADVKQTIDTLKLAGFQLEHIRANVQIVLYSRDLIVNRLRKFSEGEQFGKHRWANLPKSLQLQLILYDIEAQSHFSGDGVWLDRKYDGD